MMTWLLYFFVTLLMLIILVISSDSRDAVRFHARFLLYYLISSTIAVLSLPYVVLRPKDVKNCLDMSGFLKQVTKILGIQWELRGADELAVERGCIIVSNHQSALDVLGMFNIWQVMGKCAAVAKNQVFYVWPFGLVAWLAGVVFIKRGKQGQALATLNETTVLVKHQKTKMWIFAEGTRNKNVLENGLLPFKKGAFILAIENQVPILPVVFSPYYFINQKNHYFGKGKMIIQTLKPIYTEGLKLKDVDDLINKTHKVMLEAFEALVEEVLEPLPPDYPGLRKLETRKTALS